MAQSLPIRSSFTEAASPFSQRCMVNRLEFPRSRYINCTRSTTNVKPLAGWSAGRPRPAKAAFDQAHNFGPRTASHYTDE